MIIVTGHMGFVGRHLVRALMQIDDGPGAQGFDIRGGGNILTCELPEPHTVERVYHLAANTDAMSTAIESMMRTNVLGTARLLERYGYKVVLASSSMVNYPVTPYAISKLACEHMATACGAAVVRFPNLYGDGGHSAVDVFAREPEITIRGSGEQLRSYAHVENAVSMLIAAKPGETKVLYGEEYSVNDIIAKFHPNKPVRRAPAHPLDILGGVQL